ncbi:penicillin-binding protein [Epidermidibacterium keratini]|uniref:Penicillin-binding protein n=1 Tax=Epidermidibacterium keratini TaxID=1891644 RepID=A0A7L4YNZ9_9ACTN|nr:transglycosylase domain-containing protein [Epidermidibacterium keratini]QHC00623.1 penicillin-binding protein [Epidermidibacterium keratini]
MRDGSNSDPGDDKSALPRAAAAHPALVPIRSRRGRSGSGAGKSRASRGRGRKIFTWVAVAAVVSVFLGSGVLGYAFQTTNVPRPEDVKISQYSTIYYASGEEMARVGVENRTLVSLDRVPKQVQQAVLAAENRSFYSDPGFSPSGIARAAWTNFTEGTTQGGSTITQQYVKKAYLTDDQTISRKFKELIIALKLERDYSKDEILEFYLNTIYFGRGAYGIEAASEVYFGKPVEQLTVEEGAVLASSIRSPAGYDPQNHPEKAADRWTYVLDGMLESDWITQEQRDAAQYPQVLPIGPGTLNKATGSDGIIVTRVKDELAALGYDEDRINREGLQVTTTIPKSSQDAAVAAVQQQLEGEPANLIPGLVSVEPTTGAIRAYYGNSEGTGFDYAGRGYRQPGSSFKPFVLAAALENGYADNSVMDGSSPQTFPDRKQPVRNSGGASCGSCTLKEAITKSLNTTFYGLSYAIGGDKVAEMAHRVGIGEKRLDTGAPTLQEDNGAVASAIGIGLYEVTVRDMASAFATYAAGGVKRTPYMVQKVTDSAGNVLYEHQDDGEQVVSSEVANDVSYALEGVASYSNDPLADGRPSAAKTGTVQLGDENNKDAWMVGYTPQLSTAVWIGSQGSDPIVTSTGKIIYGAGIPGKIWQQYMNTVLDGAEIMDMPDKALIKASKKGTSGGGSGNSSKKSSSAPAPTTEAPAPTTEAPTSQAPEPTVEAPQTTEAPAPTTQAPPPTTAPPAPTTQAPPPTQQPNAPSPGGTDRTGAPPT